MSYATFENGLLNFAKEAGRGATRPFPPSLKTHSEYCESNDWFKSFEPKPDFDYEVLLAYAAEKYKDETAAFESLDKKAEGAFNLAAALAALVFSAINMSHSSLTFGPWIRASFVCFFLSMLYSMLCRQPMEKSTSAKIPSALAHAERHGGVEAVKGELAASLHCAIVGTNVANSWKADKLVLITLLLVIAIGCLMIGLL